VEIIDFEASSGTGNNHSVTARSLTQICPSSHEVGDDAAGTSTGGGPDAGVGVGDGVAGAGVPLAASSTGAGCPGTAGALVGWDDSALGGVFGATPPGSSNTGASIPAPMFIPGLIVGSDGLGLEPAPIRYRELLAVRALALLGLSPGVLPGMALAAADGSLVAAARIPRASKPAGGPTGMMLGLKE
jgi:hypothetical protein